MLFENYSSLQLCSFLSWLEFVRLLFYKESCKNERVDQLTKAIKIHKDEVFLRSQLKTDYRTQSSFGYHWYLVSFSRRPSWLIKIHSCNAWLTIRELHNAISLRHGMDKLRISR